MKQKILFVDLVSFLLRFARSLTFDGFDYCCCWRRWLPLDFDWDWRCSSNYCSSGCSWFETVSCERRLLSVKNLFKFLFFIFVLVAAQMFTQFNWRNPTKFTPTQTFSLDEYTELCDYNILRTNSLLFPQEKLIFLNSRKFRLGLQHFKRMIWVLLNYNEIFAKIERWRWLIWIFLITYS